jgi:hypothetical protein
MFLISIVSSSFFSIPSIFLERFDLLCVIGCVGILTTGLSWNCLPLFLTIKSFPASNLITDSPFTFFNAPDLV